MNYSRVFSQRYHRLIFYQQVAQNCEVFEYIYLMKKTSALGNRRISTKPQQQFREFLQMAARYGNDKQAAFDELAKYYSNTYYFYYVYRVSGLQNE